MWPARGRSAFQLGRDLRHVAAPEPRAGARLSDRRRFLANGRSILYHGEKSDSQRTGLGRRRHGKNSQHGEADSGHSKRQKIHMKRKRCAKCSGKGTVLCAVCEYLSDKRAATHYGWISPYNIARYAQAPTRPGRHKRKSAKF